MPDGSATAHLHRPKLVTQLREGYSFTAFRKDTLAALTVAIVALPLSMAIAVASGVPPARACTRRSLADSWFRCSEAAAIRSAVRPERSSCWLRLRSAATASTVFS